MADKDSSDRKRAMLSPADRRFLKNEIQYDKRQSEYKRREAIRTRVGGALSDFDIVIEHLSEEETERIFSELLDTETNAVSEEARQSLISTLRFLYTGIVHSMKSDETSTTIRREWFSEMLETAIEESEADHKTILTEFDLVVETEIVIPWEKLRAHIEQRGVTHKAYQSLQYHLQHNRKAIDTDEALTYLDEYYQSHST